MNLAEYRALPACTRCGARCVPFHTLTDQHVRLSIRPLGSYQSSLCATCYKAGYLDRHRAKSRDWKRAQKAAAA